MAQGRHLGKPLDDEAAWEIVFELGGLPPESIDYLDEAKNDEARRLTLRNWFGTNGARVSWAYYKSLKRSQPMCVEN